MAADDSLPNADSPCIAFPLWLIPLIRCPITKGALKIASRDFLDRLKRSTTNTLRNGMGVNVSEIPSQGLLSHDECWLYPVRDGIPTLIPGEAIAISCPMKETPTQPTPDD